MLTELDVFNAEVLLAMARCRRLPFQVAPVTASAVSSALEKLNPHDVPAEKAAFTRLSKGGFHSAYEAFWDRFDFTPSNETLRVIVGCPESYRRKHKKSTGTTLYLECDSVATSHKSVLAAPVIDDLMVFSDAGFVRSQWEAILSRMGEASTITLLRPAQACDFWFNVAGVKHDCSELMEAAAARAEIKVLFSSEKNAPVMATIFGLNRLKL